MLVSQVPPAMSRIETILEGFSPQEQQTVNHTLRSTKSIYKRSRARTSTRFRNSW